MTTPRTWKPFVTLGATVRGWDAWNGGDGETTLINYLNGALRDLALEVLDTMYLLRVHDYRVHPDWCGRGQWRGGDGVIRDYKMLADLDLSLWWERSVTPAWGAAGSEAGTAPQFVISPARWTRSARSRPTAGRSTPAT